MTERAHDVLFPHDNDPLRRYQREDAEAKAASEREQLQQVDSPTIRALHGEIATLRSALKEQGDLVNKLLGAVGQLAEGLNKVESWSRKLVEERVLRSEIATLRARLDEQDQTFVRLADTIDVFIDKTPTWVKKVIEGRVLNRKPGCAARSRRSLASCEAGFQRSTRRRRERQGRSVPLRVREGR